MIYFPTNWGSSKSQGSLGVKKKGGPKNPRPPKTTIEFSVTSDFGYMRCHGMFFLKATQKRLLKFDGHQNMVLFHLTSFRKKPVSLFMFFY